MIPKGFLLRILYFFGGAGVMTLAAWWLYNHPQLYVAKPAAPKVISAELVGNGCAVNVYYSDNSTNEIGFRVNRRNGPFIEPWEEVALLGPHAGISATYTESNLPNGWYVWQVCAFNQTGESCSINDSNEIEINDPDCSPDNENPYSIIITDVAVEGSCKARFWFTDNINTETGLHIYRREVGELNFSQIAEQGPHPGVPGSYDDPNLEIGTYEYQIGAFDNSTEYLSNISDPVKIEDLDCQTFVADLNLPIDGLLPTPTPQACNWKAAVNVFVRTGPGASIYPEITAVEVNSSLLVVGQSEDEQFWAVELQPGVIGYVSKAEKFGQAAGDCNVPILSDPEPSSSDPQNPAGGGGTPQCNDGVDNDRDGLIDMRDRDCSNPEDTGE